MKINSKELAEASFGESIMEGRLHYKKITSNRPQSGFKERWFKLRLNVLFYFSLSDTGTVVSPKPSGGYILEQCTANCETLAETPFTFILAFPDERIVFSGRSDEQIKNWVSAINSSSYEFLRARFKQIQMQLNFLTGEKPYQDVWVAKKSSEKSVEKHESFRSYLESETDASGLTFIANHFGFGKISNETNVAKLENLSLLDLETSENNKWLSEQVVRSTSTQQLRTQLSCGDMLINNSCSLSRPRPVRKAPPPPPIPERPPRGQKNSSCSTTNISDNLIDL